MLYKVNLTLAHGMMIWSPQQRRGWIFFSVHVQLTADDAEDDGDDDDQDEQRQWNDEHELHLTSLQNEMEPYLLTIGK